MGRIIKKIMVTLLATVFLFGCGSSTSKQEEVVKTYLEGMKNGDVEKIKSVLSDDLKSSDGFYSFENEFKHVVDDMLTYLPDQFRFNYSFSSNDIETIDNLLSAMFKFSCKDYTIDDIAKKDNSRYVISVTVTYPNVNAVVDEVWNDNDDFQFKIDEIEEKYGFSVEQDFDDVSDDEVSWYVRESYTMLAEIIEYLSSSYSGIEYDTTTVYFEVIKQNGKWCISNIDGVNLMQRLYDVFPWG